MLTGSAAAGGIALINSVGNLGGFLGPYAMGLVQDATGSFPLGLLTIAIGSIIGGLLCCLVMTGDWNGQTLPQPTRAEIPGSLCAGCHVALWDEVAVPRFQDHCHADAKYRGATRGPAARPLLPSPTAFRWARCPYPAAEVAFFHENRTPRQKTR
jgi:hypothetical protein